MALVDSHAHLTSDPLASELTGILSRAQACGVGSIVNICTDQITLERGLVLKQSYPWIHNVAATTPHDVVKEGESFFPLVEQAALAGDLVAIGETGLDYHYEHSPRELQKFFCRRYLALALKSCLPVVIHCREAFTDFFEIIDRDYQVGGQSAPGVLHCFTGTLDEARGVLERGWYLSLSGIVTFKKSAELREVAKLVPLDQLLIETDSPYLAPQSKRGKQNEPSFLPEIAALIASVKGVPLEAVAEATSANARRFFKIEE